MCRCVKPYNLIEVNNLELEPKYYFRQMRIALCLECSKRFEFLRNNRDIREGFLKRSCNAAVQNQGTVDIPLGSEETVRFTGKHLAEIQEILRNKPD